MPTANQSPALDKLLVKGFLQRMRDINGLTRRLSAGTCSLDNLDAEARQALAHARANAAMLRTAREKNQNALDELCRIALSSTDASVRRGFTLIANALLTLPGAYRHDESDGLPESVDIAVAKGRTSQEGRVFPRHVMFAVFGQALLPDQVPVLDVQQLERWICQHIGLPKEAVTVYPLPLNPASCLSGLSHMNTLAARARNWDKNDVAHADVIVAESEHTLKPRVFLVTTIVQTSAQQDRILKTVMGRGALGRPNEQDLQLPHAGGTAFFRPHDIDFIFSSMSDHVHFEFQQQFRAAVRVIQDYGRAPKQLECRIRAVAQLRDKPAMLWVELCDRETKDIVEAFPRNTPTVEEAAFFIPQVMEMCRELGVGKVKVNKHLAARAGYPNVVPAEDAPA